MILIYVINIFLFSIAYPFSDLTLPRTYKAKVGETKVMNCTIPMSPFARMWSNSSVAWYKGLDKIDTSSSHYSLDGFALVISDVNYLDYGQSYYCQVNMTIQNQIMVSRQGSTLTLNIIGILV